MLSNDLIQYQIDEIFKEGDETQAHALLAELIPFLERFYPASDVPSIDTFIADLNNDTTLKAFVTFYKKTITGEPAAAIVSYDYLSKNEGTGFLKFAAIDPDNEKARADNFLAGEIIEHKMWIAEYTSLRKKQYRGTFVEVYTNAEGESFPSPSQLSAIMAEPVNVGGYVVPSPSLVDMPGKHDLFVTDFDTLHEPTAAMDLEQIIHQVAKHAGYTLKHSYPVIEAMIECSSEMTLSDIPIRHQEQTPEQQRYIAKTGLGNLLGSGKKDSGPEPTLF